MIDTLSEDDVRAYKLSNGMEIYGKVVDENSEIVELDDAVIALVQQGARGADGQQESALRFVAVSPLSIGQAQSKILLRKTSIIFEYKPEPAYHKAYRGTVSGLILATA
jgi:hypothetical protein